MVRKAIEKQIVLFSLNDIGMFTKFLQFVDEEDFSDGLYGFLYKLQKKHYQKHGKLINKQYLVDFVREFRQKKELPENDIDCFLTQEPAYESKEDILDNALKIVHKHRVVKAIDRSLHDIESPDFSPLDIQTRITEALAVNYDTDLGSTIFDFDKRIDGLTRAKSRAIPSFSPKLNEFTAGGRFPGELYVYMGPPGVGKSLFLIQDAYYSLIKGFNSVYVTAELSELRVGLRFDSLHSRMTSKEIYDNPQVIRDKYTLLKKTTHGDIRIKEYPTKTATVMDINIYLDQLKLYEGFEPDILYVDYGDILKPMRQRDKDYSEQGEIFEALRATGIERNIPVVTATQSTRDMINKASSKVDMRQVSDSFVIPRIADGMYAICQNQKQRKNGVTKLKIIKNRNGRINWLITYTVDYTRMRIQESEIAPEQADESED